MPAPSDKQRQIQTNFTGGEFSPNLFARTDMAKYKNGAAILRNFFVDFRGGASTRAGTQFIAYTQEQEIFNQGRPRVLPFIVGQEDGFIAEFGTGYVKMWQYGVYQTTLATPYALADIPLLKISQNADVMTITHPNYPSAQITLNNGAWSYAVIQPKITQDPPTNLNVTSPSTTNPDYCYCYVVTAVSQDGKSESIACAPFLIHYTILDQTKGYITTMVWQSPVNPISLYNIYKCGPFDDRVSTGPGTVFGYIGSSQTTSFTDLNFSPDFTRTPPVINDPFSGGQFESISVINGGSGYTSGQAWRGYVPLIITPNAGQPGTGAAGYAITNYQGVVTGAFFTNYGKNYLAGQYTITTGGAGSGATFNSSVTPPTPLYPGVSTYYQQRQVFAGITAKPETLFLTKPGDYLNFSSSVISQASDAIAEDISSSEVNRITGFMTVAAGLMVFTTGGVFLTSGGAGANSALTPSTITNNPQASNGSSDLPPIRINYSVLYLQYKGNIVRDCSFAWQRQGYTAQDISTISNHLFFNQTITEWSWAEEPWKQVYAVRADGTLLSMAYVPDQEVTGWAHHDTNGFFRSVATVPEYGYNVTYFICERWLNNDWVYTLERMDPRTFKRIEDAWFVDCGLSLPGVTNANYPGSAGWCGAEHASGNYIGLNAVGTAASAGIFSQAQVGDIFWGLSGKAEIVQVVSPSRVMVNILVPFPEIPNQIGDDIPIPFGPNDWSYGPLYDGIRGLDHLDNMQVAVIADGMYQGIQTVVNGGIALNPMAAKAIVGLPYSAQLQTLKIELEGRPTVQGSRKNIIAVTLRLFESMGGLVGSDWSMMDPFTTYAPEIPYTPPLLPYTGDVRIPIPPDWNIAGQMCVQQNDPYPLTVLGLIPEVLVGDTAG